jgi:septum formation protein
MGLPIFLASTSPRRHALLNQVNIVHGQLAVAIDETQYPDERPIDYIERMVMQKAVAALAIMHDDHQQALVITADTIGVLRSGAVLQKPNDYQEAVAMWQQMSDGQHQVWTAVQVSLVGYQDGQLVLLDQQRQTVKTEVDFVKLTEPMMADYWATGEPHDKAGGYAIQGQGAAWVKSIHGSYSNVVGLPLVETIELINHFQATN